MTSPPTPSLYSLRSALASLLAPFCSEQTSSDLVKKIKLPVHVDFIRAKSYGSGTVSNDTQRISFDLKINIQGKHNKHLDQKGLLQYIFIHHFNEMNPHSLQWRNGGFQQSSLHFNC
ncbi:hypothetical protein ACSBR1_013151 [Camellia fascicularis]